MNNDKINFYFSRKDIAMNKISSREEAILNSIQLSLDQNSTLSISQMKSLENKLNSLSNSEKKRFILNQLSNRGLRLKTENKNIVPLNNRGSIMTSTTSSGTSELLWKDFPDPVSYLMPMESTMYWDGAPVSETEFRNRMISEKIQGQHNRDEQTANRALARENDFEDIVMENVGKAAGMIAVASAAYFIAKYLKDK